MNPQSATHPNAFRNPRGVETLSPNLPYYPRNGASYDEDPRSGPPHQPGPWADEACLKQQQEYMKALQTLRNVDQYFRLILDIVKFRKEVAADKHAMETLNGVVRKYRDDCCKTDYAKTYFGNFQSSDGWCDLRDNEEIMRFWQTVSRQPYGGGYMMGGY